VASPRLSALPEVCVHLQGLGGFFLGSCGFKAQLRLAPISLVNLTPPYKTTTADRRHRQLLGQRHWRTGGGGLPAPAYLPGPVLPPAPPRPGSCKSSCLLPFEESNLSPSCLARQPLNTLRVWNNLAKERVLWVSVVLVVALPFCFLRDISPLKSAGIVSVIAVSLMAAVIVSAYALPAKFETCELYGEALTCAVDVVPVAVSVKHILAACPVFFFNFSRCD
jgi:hypothetical protein